MIERQLTRPERAQTQRTLPLFYRKRICANGESDEVSVGPSVVCIFRWIVILAITALLFLVGARPSELLRFLLTM